MRTHPHNTLLCRIDPEGSTILKERPRVNETTWNQKELLALPENSFGHHYAKWMGKFQFTPEDRTPCKYVPDLELAYIMQRYREVNESRSNSFSV